MAVKVTLVPAQIVVPVLAEILTEAAGVDITVMTASAEELHDGVVLLNVHLTVEVDVGVKLELYAFTLLNEPDPLTILQVPVTPATVVFPDKIASCPEQIVWLDVLVAVTT